MENSKNRDNPLKSIFKIFAKNRSTDIIFESMIKIFSNNSEAIKVLRSCRITPQINKDRSDIEFFIPQLCSYLISKDNKPETKHVLIKFLREISRISYNFSHRLLFYVKAMMANDLLSISASRTLFKLKDKVMKASIKGKEEIFVENSENILKYSLQNNIPIFALLTQESSPIKYSRIPSNRRIQEVSKISHFYGLNSSMYPEEPVRLDLLQNIKNIDISSQEIVLNPFQESYPLKMKNPINSVSIQFNEDKNQRLTNFLSAIRFTKYLCNISLDLIKYPPEERLVKLKEELSHINILLPSNAYIPFSNLSIRNKVILHIPISECRVFNTKEKAPFLITIEVMDPNIILKSKTKPLSKVLDIEERRIKDSEEFKNGIQVKSFPLSFTQASDSQELGSGTSRMMIKSKKIISNSRILTKVENNQIVSNASPDPEKKSSHLYQILSNQIHLRLNSEIFNSDKKKKVIISHNENQKFLKEKSEIVNPIDVQEKLFDTERKLSISSMWVPQERQEFEDSNQTFLKNSNLEPFGSMFDETKDKIKRNSPYSKISSWNIVQVIIKSGSDLRQEELAMQLIYEISQIFKDHKVKAWLRPYEIISTGKKCGLIEYINNTISLDSLKKRMKEIQIYSLYDFFQYYYKDKNKLKKARINFAKSLAGYSLVSYILQIKDRHNANILLDSEGHIIHIDYDFILSSSPGNINIESCPFKLTQEYVEILGNGKSSYFNKFRHYMIDGFMAMQSDHKKIISLVEMILVSNKDLKCFRIGENVVSELENRLFPKIHGLKPNSKMNRLECSTHIDNLINGSFNNLSRRGYDLFQQCCNGII